jgi:hypothetical protein
MAVAYPLNYSNFDDGIRFAKYLSPDVRLFVRTLFISGPQLSQYRCHGDETPVETGLL